ncbi:MAG: hypothetical protein HC911_18035 [Chloroflexaceae bacterium]|nr:hypothetical protein [Chloroflexaceae bacterium]
MSLSVFNNLPTIINTIPGAARDLIARAAFALYETYAARIEDPLLAASMYVALPDQSGYTEAVKRVQRIDKEAEVLPEINVTDGQGAVAFCLADAPARVLGIQGNALFLSAPMAIQASAKEGELL